MRKLFLILSMLTACAVHVSVQAQIRIIPREKIEAIANPEHSSDSSWLSFNTKSIIADPMNEDDSPKTFRYVFRNVGPETLQIRRLVTTCSCAVARCGKDKVEPGDSAVINVTYHPEGHPGRFERRIFVYTQDGSSPAAILSLSVNVEAGEDFSSLYGYQMGTIRLRRTEITFSKGERGVETIPFVNIGDKMLKMEYDKDMLPDCLSVSFEPEEAGSRQEGKIIISYDPSKGHVRDEMSVMLKGLGLSPRMSSIKVKIKND